MIIETSDNRFFRVRETNDPNLAHVWHGLEVKRVKGGYAPKKRAREILVRKAGAHVVLALEPNAQVAEPLRSIVNMMAAHCGSLSRREA